MYHIPFCKKIHTKKLRSQGLVSLSNEYRKAERVICQLLFYYTRFVILCKHKGRPSGWPEQDQKYKIRLLGWNSLKSFASLFLGVQHIIEKPKSGGPAADET